jgi:trypsin
MIRFPRIFFAALVACLNCVPGTAFGAGVRHARPGGQATSNIVGGSDASDGSFPWLAFIVTSDSTGTYTCTGTVISSNLILTAGHCACHTEAGSLFAPSSYAVVTGSSDWTDKSTRHVSGVTQTFLAPGYSPATDDHDAAILELSTPTTAPAIPLATSPASLYPGNVAAIAGWGLTDASDPGSAPDQLQYASTVVQKPGYCLLHNAQFDTTGQLCTVDAPYDDTSFCYGDSGGPVIANELQGEPGTPTEIGVIDESADCTTNGPGYSARVDAIAPWAEGLISTLTPPTAPVSAPPAPKQTTPLGSLTVAVAKTDASEVLGGVFGNRFRHGQQVILRCSRVSSTRVSCSTTWTYGPTDYYGGVTIYLTVQKAHVVWTDHYLIRSVNDNCYFHSRHRRSCQITKHAGAF